VPLQERLMRQRIKFHRRLTLDALMPFHEPFRSLCPGGGRWCRTVTLVSGSWPARPAKTVLSRREQRVSGHREARSWSTKRGAPGLLRRLEHLA
jgi:hypothetical protein